MKSAPLITFILVCSMLVLNVPAHAVHDLTTRDRVGAPYQDSALLKDGPKAGTFNSLGTGTFLFAGSDQQPISGQNAFVNLIINNPNGVLLNSDTKVTGVLTLTNGIVALGGSNLILGTGATIAGTPSATNMIAATGSGQLMKTFTGTGSFLYPVGDNTGTAEYSPVTLSFTAGTFGSDANVGVNLVNAKYAYDSVAGQYLKRYWTVTQQNITGFLCNAMFQYLPADVTGTESLLYCEKINPLPVVEYDRANTVTHQLTAAGLSSFGTYTGNRALYKNLNLTVFLEGLYSGSGTMRAAANAVGPQWGPTIADHITVELHDPVTYSTIRYSAADVPLNTNGTASVTIPRAYSGNFYLTVKHRNSLETTTAAPVPVNTTSVGYNFSSSASSAFSNNIKSLGGGVFGIYAGDISSAAASYPSIPVHDGVIDIYDNYYIYLSFLNGDYGYYPGDVNGDGVVDLLDAFIAYTNYIHGVYAITP
jgi:trimeric autotransporter adhesin